MRKITVHEFLKTVESILQSVLEVDKIAVPITMETELVGNVGKDSLSLSSIDYVDFLVCIENEYDIVYDFDTRIYTLRDMYDYVMMYEVGDDD